MRNRSVQTRSFGLVEAFTVAAGLIAIAMILSGIWFTSAILEQNGRLDKATDILQVKVSLAHLWFEEAVVGDQSINLDVQVYANIDEALALCRAMLTGGQTSMGQMQAVNDGEVRASLTALRERLQLWRNLTAARWEERRSSQPGTEGDQVYDAVFNHILQLCGEIDRAIDGTLARGEMVLTWVNRGVILCLFMIFVGITLVVRRSRRSIETKNAELEMRVQERTAGLFSEITERQRAEQTLRESEEQYRSLVETAKDAIFTVSTDGTFTSLNPAFETVTDWSRAEWLGKSFAPLAHPDDLPLATDLFQRLLQGETPPLSALRILLKSGASRIWEFTATPQFRGGEVAGVLVIVRDITERKQIERLKDEFVSVVSHELRTPLTSIRGALGLLTSGLIGSLPERGQRMVEIAVNNTDRLVRLINDILDIERMQSGKVIMQRQLCDAAALLNQAADEMRALADKAGVTLAVEPQALRLWADPDRLVQTLTNLLSNAIKFSPTGSTVWVRVTRRDEEAVFAVKDQGRGIPADKLESIFERFQQVDASDSRQKGGTGLGLAICRSIVQQHGGRIWVASQLGAGSTFSFTLPVWQEAEQALAGPVGRPVVLVGDDAPGVGRRCESSGGIRRWR